MNTDIYDISSANNYGKIVSAFATAEKRELQPKGTEQSEMKDTASTSSLARMAAGILKKMRGEEDHVRQEKIDKFKSMANEESDLATLLGSDDVVDTIFARMFG
jgi:hypothetical protein